jgi:hypothetical protein
MFTILSNITGADPSNWVVSWCQKEPEADLINDEYVKGKRIFTAYKGAFARGMICCPGSKTPGFVELEWRCDLGNLVRSLWLGSCANMAPPQGES